MRLKKKKENKDGKIGARCTNTEENEVQLKANMYTDGNVSEWVLYAALNFIPSKDELKKE